MAIVRWYNKFKISFIILYRDYIFCFVFLLNTQMHIPAFIRLSNVP